MTPVINELITLSWTLSRILINDHSLEMTKIFFNVYFILLLIFFLKIWNEAVHYTLIMYCTYLRNGKIHLKIKAILDLM